MKIRINRLLSEAGLGSRREVEVYIKQGRVVLNGKTASLSDLVGLDDLVLVDGVDLPTRDLVREHISLEKVARHVKSKNEERECSTRGKAKERAESQRLKHAPKSAALRKTSKNNPINKRKRALAKGELERGDY